MLTNITLTDPQGQTFNQAIVLVRHAQHNINNLEELRRDESDLITPIEGTRVNSFINCSFFYWASQENLSNGLKPYVLFNTNNNNMAFDFDASGAEYQNLTLEEKCEKYFQDVILPSLG